VSIKIVVEKVLTVEKEKGLKIVSISGVLAQEELPKEFKKGKFAYRMGKSGIYFPHLPNMVIGETETKESLETQLEFLRESGQKLHEINKKLAIENANWRGGETYIV